jgi:protein SCO1
MTRVASGGLPAAMHFLTGPESSSADIADAIGFRFRWDAELQQYAHVSGVAVLTSDGRLARWLAGIGLEPIDLRLAVAEAGRGGIGGLADRLLLLCAHYDPRAGRYTSVVHGALKIGGVITVLALAIPIAFAVARERRRQRPSERVV